MSSNQVSTNPQTLTRFIIAEQQKFPDATGDLTLLLQSIQLACKIISSSIRKASLINLYGLAGNTNVQGEEVKKLDVLSNETFINTLKFSQTINTLVSEENDDPILVDDASGKYAVVFDPLDGSSNIDAGVSVGTIFGIYSRVKGGLGDVLCTGSNMVAAGYAMYGSSTMLVLTTGKSVNGFTLDPEIGEFILTHRDITIPQRGKIFSVNEGNTSKWDDVVKNYIQEKKDPKEEGAKPYSARYIGSMVSDVHRNLLYGGIFMYPADSKNTKGKLRVLYECFPMAMIFEAAGGMATDGRRRILDIVPESIHERTPLFIGSKLDVEDITNAYLAADKKN